MIKPVFFTNFFEQKKAIESLIRESRANTSFYLFLSIAAFISTLGFMVNNAVVISGGMLVAPLLIPILSLGMGIAMSSMGAIGRAMKTLAKSVVTVFLISFLTAFFLSGTGTAITEQMKFASDLNIITFLVAFASGIVAAYSVVKESTYSVLPSIAVTVSLLPPLSVVGIAASLFSKDLFASSFTLFLVNFLGIVVASTIVFALFGFSGLQSIQERRLAEEREEERRQREMKEIVRHGGVRR